MNPRFNLPSTLSLCGHSIEAKLFFKCLLNDVTPERLEKIEEMAALKTFDVAVITENIFDRGNLNAIMRSCENFGFTKFYSYEAGKIKKANPNSQRTTTGADKWLEYQALSNYGSDIEKIKAEGYKIIATSLSQKAKPINEIDFTSSPVAIVFGNEKSGITAEMEEIADELCIIENAGFTQSLNVSVAAAITMYEIFRRRKESGLGTGLNENERELLKSHYLLRAFQKFEYRWEDLLKLFYQRKEERQL